VEDSVSFAGFVDPVGDVYAAADVIVNPVRVPEGFGRTALEGLAAGKPVIASRIGAIPEVLIHEEHALLVRPERPEDLSAAIIRLWRDDELRNRLVDQGRAHVAQNFSESAGVEAFRSAVEAVCERA
jgi:glycosyltransferase involved in cell wall biosynthesis